MAFFSRSRWVGAAVLSVALGLTACRTTEPYIVKTPPPGVGKELPTTAVAEIAAGLPLAVRREYREVVAKVAAMTSDAALQRRVTQRGLALQNVSWEDTGRSMGSALGPNISDLTLQVREVGERDAITSTLMPVIRFPNFTDRTGDVPADRLFVRVNNQRPGDPDLVSLRLTDLLRNLSSHVSVPSSLGSTRSLLAERDTHFLVSAQAVFLPIPKEGKATFNPVLFNYQSAPGSPAVLTILVTRQGTSVRVIENRPEDASGAVGLGQELYFNHGGKRASFTAERRSDVVARIEAQGGPKSQDDRSALQQGADVLFLIQVPLKHANRGRLGGVMAPTAAGAPLLESAAQPSAPSAPSEGSDVEQAVLGHGADLGEYREGAGATLERDPAFPVRVTVQFYKATSNGVVDDQDLDAIAKSIASVYEHADFVGSLVVPEGDRMRPTAWQTMPREWFPW
jgi:hypothetical protein